MEPSGGHARREPDWTHAAVLPLKDTEAARLGLTSRLALDNLFLQCDRAHSVIKLVHAPRAPHFNLVNWSGDTTNQEAWHNHGVSKSSASLGPE